MVLMTGIQNKGFGFITKPEPDAGTVSIPTCYPPRPSDICQDSCDENDYVWTNGISGYSVNQLFCDNQCVSVCCFRSTRRIRRVFCGSKNFTFIWILSSLARQNTFLNSPVWTEVNVFKLLKNCRGTGEMA